MQNPVIGIIGGKGRMGKLFADFFLAHGIDVQVSDIATKISNRELAKSSDIVIVSVPIDVTLKTIKEILPYMKKDAAIMDFTSVKEHPVNAMLKGKCEVLGMHPMFGNSNPIPGQTIILCPTEKSGKWSGWIENFLRKNKTQIIKISPIEHDKIMNIAQGLIHFAEITFADSLRRMKMPLKDLLKFTGRASEMKIQLAARLIDQDAGLYGNIQICNPQALKSIGEFKKSVDELYNIVSKKNLNEFKKYFNNNKKFYGKYTHEAYIESSHLIDRLIEMRKDRQGEDAITPSVKPTKNSIAILGPKNTFSDFAASKYLKKTAGNAKKYYAKELDEIFELVEKQRVKEGIVPIENKLHGTIRESLDNLFKKDIHIIGEISIPIHHCLVCLSSAKPQDIKKIISHSQALNQCKNFLKKKFPKAEKESVSSTGAALEKVLSSNDTGLAAIAPRLAASSPEFKIIAENIEDEKDNSTSFFIIRKGKTVEQKNSTKTSIAFHFDKDKPGSLFEIFKIFADGKINLTKIESRPTKKQFGDYIFYLDFEGRQSETRVKKTLSAIAKKVAKLKILGCY